MPVLVTDGGGGGPLGLLRRARSRCGGGHTDAPRSAPDRPSGGSGRRQVVVRGGVDRSIQVGIRTVAPRDCGIKVLDAYQAHALGVDGIAAQIRERVGQGPAYLTFDIDALDPAFAPGTGTPEVGGLTTREVLELLRGLKGVNLVGGDVVEVAPQYDATANTAHAGAQVLFEILSLMVFSPSVGRR